MSRSIRAILRELGGTLGELAMDRFADALGVDLNDDVVTERAARELLGLPPHGELTADQIRDAHRRVARELHPDRGGSASRMAAANAARDVLLARFVGSDGGRTD